METLAINKSAEESLFIKILEILGGLVNVALTVFLIWVSIHVIRTDAAPLGVKVEMVALSILLFYCCIFYYDNYMRSFHAVETIGIHDGMLVIECTNSLLRGRKSIPLTSIRRVEKYRGSTAHLTIPDTLRVRYGRRRYRFGINMTDVQRTTLANTIMELAKSSGGGEENL